jgi:invasion protein IalB
VLAAVLSFAATPSMAQDQPAPAPAPDAAASGGQQAAVPQPDWQKVCGKVKEEQECQISRTRVAATGQPIAQMLIIERGDKKLLQVNIPPVVLIQPGLKLTIDDADPTGMKYVACTPSECIAYGEINADFIAKLKKGKVALITMLNPQNKPVNFDISLAGFTAVYDGPGIDPQQAQAAQQKLEDELKKKADEARQQLLQLQQQQSTTQ